MSESETTHKQLSNASPFEIQPAKSSLESVACGICDSSRYEFLFSSKDYIYGNSGSWPVARCLDCGVVYMNPRIPPVQIGDYYPKNYYTFVEINDPITNPRKRAVYNTIATRCLGYSIPTEEIPTYSRRARLALPILKRH